MEKYWVKTTSIFTAKNSSNQSVLFDVNKKPLKSVKTSCLIQIHCLKNCGKVCYELSCFANLDSFGHDNPFFTWQMWRFWKKRPRWLYQTKVTLLFKVAVTPENNFYVAKKTWNLSFLRKSPIFHKGKSKAKLFFCRHLNL